MKLIAAVSQVFFFLTLLAYAGCEPAQNSEPPPIDNNGPQVPLYTYYAPVRIDIMPLTEFVGPDRAAEPQINPYVSLLDSFGCQIKSPGIFRFELYEHVPRSAEPKGRRVMISSDFDLSGPAANNLYWRDFLRAYEFNLPFEPTPDRSYILEATCLTPNGKRLSAEFPLKQPK